VCCECVECECSLRSLGECAYCECVECEFLLRSLGECACCEFVECEYFPSSLGECASCEFVTVVKNNKLQEKHEQKLEILQSLGGLYHGLFFNPLHWS